MYRVIGERIAACRRNSFVVVWGFFLWVLVGLNGSVRDSNQEGIPVHYY